MVTNNLASAILALLATSIVATNLQARKDTITLKTVRGNLRDFDGDSQLDTLYLTQQRLERNGKVKVSRTIPGFIVWGDTSAKKKYDTTTLDLPKERDVVVGVRLGDFNDDKIADIEILYRWSESTSKQEKLVKEKIWMIAGGANLRDAKTVKLTDAKKSLATASTILSERSASTREEEQPLGIGGYSIRRIRPNTVQPKQRVDYGLVPTLTEQSLEVYPNPARDVVHVRIVGVADGQSIILEVVDLNGRSVLKKEARAETDIDVRNLASGTYSIRLVGCDVCPVSVQFQITR